MPASSPSPVPRRSHLLIAGPGRAGTSFLVRYLTELGLDTTLSRSWETWCRTPGGTVYSLSPVDQARLLAMGFHRLVDRLTAADVPMLLSSLCQ